MSVMDDELVKALAEEENDTWINDVTGGDDGIAPQTDSTGTIVKPPSGGGDD